MAEYINFEADVSSESDESDLDEEIHRCECNFINDDNIEQEDESFYYSFQNQEKNPNDV